MITIYINDKEYKVKEAKTEEEKRKGLQGIKKLPENEGMLFYFNDNEKPQMWMDKVNIPLDIIFINDDMEVIYVYHAKPNDKALVSYPDTKYVLELNIDSGVVVGDDIEFDDESAPVMKVLAQDGSSQMDLYGGERIFRRAFTKQLIEWAKKADTNKNNESLFKSICRKIGKKMFREIEAQNNRKPEYVDSPK